MHHSAKPNQLSKVKIRNNNVSFPYNAGIQFLSTASVTHLAQLHINRKYLHHHDNKNGMSFFQYQRSSNLDVEKNIQEVRNQFQNLKDHQQQFVVNTLHHQHYMNTVLDTIHQPLRRKVKDSQIKIDDSRDTFQTYIKKLTQLQTQQVANTNVKGVHKRNFACISDSHNKREYKNIQKIDYKQKLPIDEYACSKHPLFSSTGHNSGNTNLTDIRSLESSKTYKGKMQEEYNIVKENNSNNHHPKVIREKTPMCLINDLARYNKIQFQYHLTSENGAAHCKRFIVTLKLGNEEYTAEGLKIKKAQHLAAKDAIEKTKYNHPIPKTSRRNDDNSVLKSNITPTVELNALAMKLGQPTYYFFDRREIALNANSLFSVDRSSRSTCQFIVTNKKCTGQFSPFKYSPTSSPCKISLIVGTKKFIGVGRTLQQAKHNAASNALQVLKQQFNKDRTETQNKCLNDVCNKSPISLVFEIGSKRNLRVEFKVLREEGPAHMRTFITACIVGDIITEAAGSGKKVSKKHAAQKMLEELNKLLPLTPILSSTKLISTKIACTNVKSEQQYKNINLSNSEKNTKHHCNKHKTLTNDTDSSNPIIKLLEWHQDKEEKEPIFKVINEYGIEKSRRRQFIMEVSSNKIVARGVGNNKNLAKRDAAQNFLIAVSEVDQTDAILKGYHLVKTDDPLKVMSNTDPNKILTSICSHNQDNDKGSEKLEQKTQKCHQPESFQQSSFDAASSDIKNLKESSSLSKSLKSQNLHSKDQLLYLAELLGFQVEFSDYPKGNHNEFLTIVMLSTNPPQICHGMGINATESQEDAANNALRILSEMGLNNAVKSE